MHSRKQERFGFFTNIGRGQETVRFGNGTVFTLRESLATTYIAVHIWPDCYGIFKEVHPRIRIEAHNTLGFCAHLALDKNRNHAFIPYPLVFDTSPIKPSSFRLEKIINLSVLDENVKVLCCRKVTKKTSDKGCLFLRERFGLSTGAGHKRDRYYVTCRSKAIWVR